MRLVRHTLMLLCAGTLGLVLATPAQSASVPTPRGLKSTAQTHDSLTLTWQPVSGARAYRVQHSTSSSMSSPKYTVFPSTTGVLSGLKPKTKYFFRVAVANASGSAVSSYTAKTYPSATTTAAPVPPPVPGPSDLHVGSFNIYGANNDASAAGDKRPWGERKAGVAADILGERADVVGLQEANQSTIYNLPGGVNQFTDLRNALNAAGAPYELANTNSYNCANPKSSNGCVYVDQGASNATRIIYNSATVTKLSSGSFKYVSQTSGKTDRYLAWATFDQTSTGKDFFFATTHLDPSSEASRKSEWNELIAKVNVLNTARLPVVVTGDFNTSKFSAIAQTMLPAMKSAGYLDVLNQEYQVNPPRTQRAEKLTNTWINSFNNFRRDITPYSYPTARTKVGNGIDWIFTTAMRVREVEVVIDVDLSTLKVVGTIPSDHNMMRATVVLP